MSNIPLWVWLLFAVGALTELYFFAMQRAALTICRASSLPEDVRFLMLPSSYRLAWWAAALKWLGAALVTWHGTVVIGLAVLAVPFFASVVMPIPRRHFLPAFEEKLRSSTDPFSANVIRGLLDTVQRLRASLAT